MSAELSLAVNILTLIDLSSKFVHRLQEFHSDVGEVPKSFRKISTELPVFVETLQRFKAIDDAESIGKTTETAVLPIIRLCQEQINELGAILTTVLPEDKESWRSKSKKAILSLHQDSKVETIAERLWKSVGLISFYFSAVSSSLEPRKGTVRTP